MSNQQSPVFFFIPKRGPKGTRIDRPPRPRVPKGTRGRLPGTKNIQTGNIMTDLIELFLDSKATFYKQKIQKYTPESQNFRAARALFAMITMVFLTITQLRSENLSIGRKSPRSGENFSGVFLMDFRREVAKTFWRYFFGTRIEKYLKNTATGSHQCFFKVIQL